MVGVRGQAGRPTGQHLQQAVIGLYAGHHQGLLVPVLPLQKTPASSLQRHIIQVSQHTPYWSCWQLSLLSMCQHTGPAGNCLLLSMCQHTGPAGNCLLLSMCQHTGPAGNCLLLSMCQHTAYWPCWQLSPTIYVSTHSLLALLATVSYYLCVNTHLTGNLLSMWGTGWSCWQLSPTICQHTGPAGNCLLLSMCQHTGPAGNCLLLLSMWGTGWSTHPALLSVCCC